MASGDGCAAVDEANWICVCVVAVGVHSVPVPTIHAVSAMKLVRRSIADSQLL